MNPVDAARLIYSDCLALSKEENPEKRFQTIREKYSDFVMRYPLIVKYMSVYFLYNEEVFKLAIEKIQKTRADHLLSLEFQADYIKGLLNDLRKKNVIELNRADIKKIREQEFEFASKEFRKILKMEKQAKKELASKDKTDSDDLRKEFIQFIKSLKD